MGKQYSIRHKSRRKMILCANHCDRIMEHLAEVGKVYEQTTKPVTSGMQELASMTEMLKSLLLSIREHI